MRIASFFWIGLFTLGTAVGISFSAPVMPDTIHVIAIRVEFQADSAATTTGDGSFDLSSPTGDFQVDPPPHNRAYFVDQLTFLRNYFHRVSGGKLAVVGDVFPVEENSAYRLDHPMTYYNPNTTPDQINTGLARLLRDALQKADADPAIDFSRYQSFVVFHAGVGKDVDLGYDETPQDIPSLFLTSDFLQKYLGQSSIAVEGGAVQIPNGMLLPETESQEGLELGLNGIFASNFGSQLGWLDLFSPETRRTGIGVFGLMDAGLFNGDGLLPAIPCAWTRIYAGWEQPNTLLYSPNDLVTIHSSLSTHPDRVFRIPINEKEYFLVENRYSGKLNLDSLRYELSRGRSDYPTVREILETYYGDAVTFSARGVLIDVQNPDIGLPGSGCLIWHIDENVIDQNSAENRINADPEHRGVDLDEADGSQDIGQEFDFLSAGSGSEAGWILDMWYQGNTAPLFKNKFTPSSVPNSRSYYNRANSHISISEFSRADSVATFRVKLDIFQQNFPRRIDPVQYGHVTSLKISDLDFDGRGEMVFTTDQGKVLGIDETGQFLWQSDTLQTVGSGEELMPPPVLFDAATSLGRAKKMIVLTRSGKAFVYTFGPGNFMGVLIQPYQSSAPATTYPVAYYDQNQIPNVLWGSENGKVYRLAFDAANVTFDSLAAIGEPVKYIHINADNQLIVVGSSGKVFRDGQLEKEIALPYSSPVGNETVAFSRTGQFLDLENGRASGAEQGLYRFDSPVVAQPLVQGQSAEPAYFVAGNNKLYAFNYNFTLLEDFPVELYKPKKDLQMSVSPLTGYFHNQALAEEPGVLVTDPAGLIDGFDLQGRQLDDFPLALGDSLSATPALLDLDGDGDVELAAVTKSGMLYVWDLAAEFRTGGWSQLYFDDMNSNRNPLAMGVLPAHPNQISNVSALLPEKEVYNWPNPNIEDYTFIRYTLTSQANVSIKIYDVAGDLVKEMSGPGEPLTANEVRWNLQDVQSGVYLARVEAQDSQKKEVRIIKIAVVK